MNLNRSPRSPFKMASLRLGGLVAAVSAVAVVGAGCDRTPPQQAGGRPPALVEVVTAGTQKDVPTYLDEIGKCTASEVVSIVPQVEGKIVERRFKDGDDLKVGDVLFVIDQRPYEAALKQAQANVAQMKAQLVFAGLEFDRMKDLLQTKAVSQTDFDTKKNALDVAQAQVDGADASVEVAKLNLDYCSIKSPINGRAGMRLVDVGNIVKANEGTLLVVQALDDVYADFTVTERDLNAVRQNIAAVQAKDASAGLTVKVRYPTDTGAGQDGQLIFLDNAVQDGSGTVRLRAKVRNTDYHFWPGQFLQVRLILNRKSEAVLVPESAIQIGQAGPFVYVVVKKPPTGPVAEMRPIQPGQRQGDMIVVESGLQKDETVIVNGQMSVTPDGPVMIQQPTPPVQATPAAQKASVKS